MAIERKVWHIHHHEQMDSVQTKFVQDVRRALNSVVYSVGVESIWRGKL